MLRLGLIEGDDGIAIGYANNDSLIACGRCHVEDANCAQCENKLDDRNFCSIRHLEHQRASASMSKTLGWLAKNW